MNLESENQQKTADGKKKVFIETWGCQMNVADSERMLSMLEDSNYLASNSADDADLVILNTCHIREKAKHKVLSRLGRLKEKKLQNPNLKIAVTGCVAQAEGRRLLKESQAIDFIVGPGKIEELPKMLSETNTQGNVSIGFKKEGNHTIQTKTTPKSLEGKNEVSRFVNIQQGCNNYCTFCVVPFTRGREISRSKSEILADCRQLINEGATEITLLGQNVNSYGLDLEIASSIPNGPFVDLLEAVSELNGLERLRFTTSNPHDFTLPLAELFKTQPKLGKYIHLPVQSGSDIVLERMKRKVTAEEYMQKIHWLRSNVSDMAISTDLIVGFPGESDEDFEKTVELVKAVEFSFIFSFKYSPRNNTPAKRFKDQIPEHVKSLRLNKLNQVQDEITIKQNQEEIGKNREVLVLYESKKAPNVYYGRTEHFRLVRIDSAENLVGQLVPVKITDANKTALVGKTLN